MANAFIKRIIFAPALLLLQTHDFLVSKFARDKAVLSEEEIPFANYLADNREVFLNEYKNFLNAKKAINVKDFYKVETDLQHDENWKAVPLVLFSYTFNENAATCPETVRLAGKLPGCCAVMFLMAGAGKHVPPHRGIYKGFYRCLFTLQLSEGADCWMGIDGQKVYFKEGKTLVFDETFEHAVLNAFSEPRIVLSLDFYRKLPFPINVLNYAIFTLLKNSPFVKNILTEYQKNETQTFGVFKAPRATMP